MLLLAAKRDLQAARRYSIRRPRIAASSFGTLDPVQIRRQATVLRLVSTAEAYVDALNGELLWVQLGPPSSLLRTMVQEIELSSSGGWGQRQKAFRRLHNVRLSDQTSWKEVEAATHARNSIAHGLGQLTASQRQNRELPTKLGLVKIGISGGQLVITDDSLAMVFDACSAFVRSVDQAA